MWTNNPYRNGIVLVFGDSLDDESALYRYKYNYVKSANDKVHTVSEFDDLCNIAFWYYGNSKWWFLIADANQLENYWELPPSGSTLIIPDLAKYQATL